MALQPETIPGFETQPLPLPAASPTPHLELIPSPDIEYGHMNKNNIDQWVEVTEQNRHFFPLRNLQGELEMRYCHSASVVSDLQNNLEAQALLKGASASPRELAFHDKKGQLYDHVTVRGLELALGGNPRHTVHFESFDKEGQGAVTSMPAGEIYSDALAYNESQDLNL